MERNNSTRASYSMRGMSFGWWLVFGLMIAILLDFGVSLKTCEYDACRFVSIEARLLPFANEVRFGQSGMSTLLMHQIYASDFRLLSPFLKAFLINSTITAIIIPIIGWRNPIFQSPLAFALFVLPGKEFFLVIAVGFIARALNKNYAKSRMQTTILIFAALTLTFLARPAYVVIGGLVLILGSWWRNKKKLKFSILISSKKRVKFLILVLTLYLVFGSGVFFNDMDVGGGFEVEATIGIVNILRESTSGMSALNISMRLFIYILYLIFLPVIEIWRVGFELSINYFSPSHVLLIGASLEWIKQVFKGGDRWTLLGYAFISSFLVAIFFPFIHTRYMLPLLVALLSTFPIQSTRSRSLPISTQLVSKI